jgi:hypothetical protein
MKRLLHFGIFLLGITLFGFGIAIISSLAASPAPPVPAAAVVTTTESPTTVLETTTSTTASKKRPTAHRTTTAFGYGGRTSSRSHHSARESDEHLKATDRRGSACPVREAERAADAHTSASAPDQEDSSSPRARSSPQAEGRNRSGTGEVRGRKSSYAHWIRNAYRRWLREARLQNSRAKLGRYTPKVSR